MRPGPVTLALQQLLIPRPLTTGLKAGRFAVAPHFASLHFLRLQSEHPAGRFLPPGPAAALTTRLGAAGECDRFGEG
jgi:hypothetical protein